MAAGGAVATTELDGLLTELVGLTKDITLESARSVVPLCKRILALDPKNQVATMFIGFAERIIADPSTLDPPDEESDDGGSSSDESSGSEPRAAGAASASASSRGKPLASAAARLRSRR